MINDIEVRFQLEKIFSFIMESDILDLPNDLSLVFFPIVKEEAKIHDSVHYYRRGSYVLKEKTIYLGYADNFHHGFNSLCHELIHAQQHHQGKIGLERYYKRMWFTWNGKKKIRAVDVENLELHEYMELPWEREAYSTEKEIAQRILNEYSEKGNKQHASVLQRLYRITEDSK